jgi:hypothetical protein
VRFARAGARFQVEDGAGVDDEPRHRKSVWVFMPSLTQEVRTP